MNNAVMKSGVLACAIALGGCGTTSTDRGISGAGIGAGAGAIIGAVTGLSVLEAAALGAVGGGLTGALTRPDQINMGDPAWKQGQTQATPQGQSWQPPAQAQELAQVVYDVQSKLAARGYDPGPIDGKVGSRTRAAIRAFQQDRGLVVDGQITPALINHLNS
jgi:peptidoglycan hydrolase-like protein with peptidoglycan-binding domain